MAHFSEKIIPDRRQWYEIFKVLKRNNSQPRIPDPFIIL